MLRLLLDYGGRKGGCKGWSTGLLVFLACKFRLVDSVNASAKSKIKKRFRSVYSHPAHTAIVLALCEEIGD